MKRHQKRRITTATATEKKKPLHWVKINVMRSLPFQLPISNSNFRLIQMIHATSICPINYLNIHVNIHRHILYFCVCVYFAYSCVLLKRIKYWIVKRWRCRGTSGALHAASWYGDTMKYWNQISSKSGILCSFIMNSCTLHWRTGADSLSRVPNAFDHSSLHWTGVCFNFFCLFFFSSLFV